MRITRKRHTVKNFIRAALLLAGFIWLVPVRSAQAQNFGDPVSFQITHAPKKINQGQSFQLKIKAKIEGNWHLYAVHNDPDAGPFPTQFKPAADHLKIDGKIKESKPTVSYDPNFKVKLGYHKKMASFTIPLVFKKGISKQAAVKVDVHYQVCNDKVCLPPTTKHLQRAVTVLGGGGRSVNKTHKKGAVPAISQNQSGQHESTSEAKTTRSGLGGSGFLSFLWIALTAGFAALLTPCVYPMIPLTVSFFSKKNEAVGPSGIGGALLFGVAIVGIFTLLGVLLALFIGAAGANRFAASPWVNLFIGVVLVVFALSLLGAFELRLPYQLTNWLNRQSNESGGWAGILFMSLTISAVSFACTAPFVGGVLAATTGGQWFYPIIGMIAFSTAFASPFVLFALFPGWLESLPKSGAWMNVVKVLLGFIELAAAVKFFSNVDLVWSLHILSRPLAIAIWIALFLLAGLYMLGLFSLNKESAPAKVGIGRLILSLPFLIFSFYLIPGLLGSSLGIWDAWLPPAQSTDVSVVSSISRTGNKASPQKSGVWSTNYQQARARARQAQKPVFIDFSGYTCTNCRAMEANVFPLGDVQKRFNKMQLVRLYTDDADKGPRLQKFQLQLTGTIALPTYAIVDPASGRLIRKISGYVGAEQFERFLKKGLEQYQTSDQI